MVIVTNKMNLRQQEKTQSTLKEMKLRSSKQRLIFSSMLGLGLGMMNLLSELLAHGLLSNYKSKLLLIIINGTCYILPEFLERFQNYSIKFSFAIGEVINLLSIYYAYTLNSHSEIIWAQFSAIIVLFYQGFLLSEIRSLVFFSIKQIFLISFAGIYYSRTLLWDSYPFLISQLTLMAFYFACVYFDYQKDQALCEAKIEILLSNEKVLSMASAIGDSMVIVNEKLHKVFSNSAYEKLVKSNSFLSFFEKTKYHRRYFTHGSSTSELLSDVTLSFKFEVGSEMRYGVIQVDGEFLELNGKLIIWDDTLSVLLFGRNMTHTLNLEKENSEGQYKSALLRTVSHELRTPTNAIFAMAQMIKSCEEISDENVERLDIITGSCTYQLCLINDLLDYAQIIAGCLKISKMPFSVAQLLSECLKLIEIQSNERLIKLKMKVNDVPEKLISDPYRIKQVILNLLSNARKFTLKGKITLIANYSNKELTIKCRDTGIGIPPEKLSVLFTQFGRIDNSSSINPHGVGLGLVISNMLVKELGGERITVSSSEGKGSCFGFTISVDEISPSDIAEENIKIFVPSIFIKSLSNKIEILLVDDTYFNILALMQIFKSEGINCSYVLSGEDAIAKIKLNSYACVLMDCEMPNLDGWETTRKLKQMFLSKEISYLPPIIASTAHNSEGIRMKCIQAGMDDILVKPCHRDIITSKVKYWIQRFIEKYRSN